MQYIVVNWRGNCSQENQSLSKGALSHLAARGHRSVSERFCPKYFWVQAASRACVDWVEMNILFLLFLVVHWHKSWICQGKKWAIPGYEILQGNTLVQTLCLLNTDNWLGKILPFRRSWSAFWCLSYREVTNVHWLYFLLKWVALKACYGVLCRPRFLFLLTITFPILVILWTTYFSIRSLMNYKNSLGNHKS